MKPAPRIGVLISGRGSNLRALIEAGRADRLGGELAVVISNRPAAAGLEHARQAGIETAVCPSAGRDREEQEREVAARLRDHRVDLVCLAGYMRRLSGGFIADFPGRILNVHPSLLPAFPGMHAQKQAFDHGVKVSGATVHLVEEALDAGPIVLQEAVPVLEGDDADTLAARILEAEHRIYPEAVRLVLGGRCRVEGRRVRIEAPSP